MLREVVAEAALDAGRALVRRVQLDVGGGDAEHLVVGNVEIHLAADAAVRTHGANDLVRAADLLRGEALPGHHLEDGAGGAHPYAFAAPGTPRLVGVAVRADDDLRVLAAPADVEHADDLNVLARPDAARAQDTGGHVVADHRIAGTLVARAKRQVAAKNCRRHDTVLHDIALELVARTHATAVAQMIGGVALQQQTQHALAVLHRAVGLGGHHHALRDLGGAGGQQLRLALDRDEADAAVADDRQLGIPAEGGDVDAGLARGVEDGAAFVRGDGRAVDGQARHSGIDTGRATGRKAAVRGGAQTKQGRLEAGPAEFKRVCPSSDLRIYREVPMRVIAVLPFVREPAIGPDLGRAQHLLAGAQDDADRFVVEDEREAGHATLPVQGTCQRCLRTTYRRTTCYGLRGGRSGQSDTFSAVSS